MSDTSFIDSLNIRDYVAEYVTDKLLDVAVIGIRNALKRINGHANILKLQAFSQEDLIDHISQHIAENIKWASNISFRDLHRAKQLDDVFVELNTYLTPVKLRIDSKATGPSIPFKEMLADTDRNIIILGQPGAGKTTSVKKIFLEVLQRKNSNYEVFNFPLIIRLKDLVFEQNHFGLSLFREILSILGIFYTFESPASEQMQEKILVHIFKDFIERLDVLIILDGFDEIGDEKEKTEVIRNLRLMTNSLLNSKFILTSRSADYNFHIDNTTEYEICPLNEQQIEDFIYKWLNDKVEADNLLLQLKKSPYWDTTMRPLTLAHLCALYERNHSIPDKPKSVYKKVIELLLEDWNNQRSVLRVSRYANFEVDRKMDFLSKFAYELTVEYNQSSFNKRTLELIYEVICRDFGLPENESRHVINEIESHNGLILQTGTDIFEFSHKSLLEYLVADFIVKLPMVSKNQSILIRIPNELAIAVAISSNPNLTYFELVCNSLKSEASDPLFLKPFLSRLIIEKPDFEPNILYSITNIFILNVIADSQDTRILKSADEEDQYDEERPRSNSIRTNLKIIENNQESETADFDTFYSDDLDDALQDELDLEEEEKLEEETDTLNQPDIDESGDISKIDLKSYYLQCAEMIISYWDSQVYLKSIDQIKTYYSINIINLPVKNPKNFLGQWGKLALLKRKSQFYKTNSIKVELPDTLIIANPLIEKKQRPISTV